MKALISPEENNRILEVRTNDSIFPIAVPLYWIDCPEDITTEWTYNGNNFIPPEDPVILSKKREYDLLIEDIKDRLKDSDWTQLPDVIKYYGKETIDTWVEYRKELRDLLHTKDLDPFNTDIPSPPYDNL